MTIEQIKQWHTEELSDNEKYLKGAEELENAGDHHSAGILRDIAHDENTHAEALKHILSKM